MVLQKNIDHRCNFFGNNNCYCFYRKWRFRTVLCLRHFYCPGTPNSGFLWAVFMDKCKDRSIRKFFTGLPHHIGVLFWKYAHWVLDGEGWFFSATGKIQIVEKKINTRRFTARHFSKLFVLACHKWQVRINTSIDMAANCNSGRNGAAEPVLYFCIYKFFSNKLVQKSSFSFYSCW